MVSALVAGVPILNPLRIAFIISSDLVSSSSSLSSLPSLKPFPQVSITLSRVFSVWCFGGFFVTLFTLLPVTSSFSSFSTKGSIVSFVSIFSTILHPLIISTLPLEINSPGIFSSWTLSVILVSSNSATGINCIINLFLIAVYTISSSLLSPVGFIYVGVMALWLSTFELSNILLLSTNFIWSSYGSPFFTDSRTFLVLSFKLSSKATLPVLG